ncbi:hypothetical protein D9619_013340 [Psilocybe cf. subviscida]|uniref:Uncharacterized protein n=1 Tax=Psilocybe cf. subviscida TaxID=2480587 RepID=A0A8H5F9R5_9AGAR|nr:hypothetical protein D9619_013340 [Psilocybe cf. subviscida]
MPTASSPSPEPSESLENAPKTVEIDNLTVQLQFREAVEPPKAGKKAPLGKLLTKTKESEFIFEATEESYYAFLSAILTAHNLSKYVPVTKRTKFGVKFSSGAQKTKKAAVDIEKSAEYIASVEKMLNGGNHLSKAIVYLSLEEVKAAYAKKSRHTDGSDNGSDSGLSAQAEDSDGEEVATDHKTLLERELGRFRGLLEKKHANPHDAGYTYIHNNGEKLPLTPAMMSEWARALYDGTAKVDEPPNTTAFDPQKRGRSLFERPAGAGSARGAGGETVLQSISSIIQDTRAIFASLSSNPVTVNNTSSILAAPATPVSKGHQRGDADSGPVAPSDPLSPMRYDPSMIPIFLEHAKDKLGVCDALGYHDSLLDKGYGPDILPEIANNDLVECGITPGDAVRLKRGASNWWNSSEAKRACTRMWRDIDDDKNTLRFEKRFITGGASSIWGAGLKPGVNLDADTYTWWFFDDVQDKLVPVPDGLIPFFA